MNQTTSKQSPKGQFTEGLCRECGMKGVSSVMEMDDTDFITIMNNGRCKECDYRASEARTARLNPKYAGRLAKKARPMYACPGIRCSHNFGTKAELSEHLALTHSTFELEQLLGLRR
jgi:hypothetical protein